MALSESSGHRVQPILLILSIKYQNKYQTLYVKSQLYQGIKGGQLCL